MFTTDIMIHVFPLRDVRLFGFNNLCLGICIDISDLFTGINQYTKLSG